MFSIHRSCCKFGKYLHAESFPCCLRKFEVMLISAHSLVILKERREVWHPTRSLRWPTLSPLLEAEAKSRSWPFPTRLFSVCWKKCFILLRPEEKPRPVADTLHPLRFTSYAPFSHQRAAEENQPMPSVKSHGYAGLRHTQQRKLRTGSRCFHIILGVFCFCTINAVPSFSSIYWDAGKFEKACL